jgi:hypothetical protein
MVRHRLSLAGNRHFNNALHIVAVCQARSDARGRAYYRKKMAEAPLPYQLAILVGFQTVFGSSDTTERLGSRSPIMRGLPI